MPLYRDSGNGKNTWLSMLIVLWTALGFFLLRTSYFHFVPQHCGDGDGAMGPSSVQGTYEMSHVQNSSPAVTPFSLQ